MFCLFCLCWGLTSQSTIVQSCRDGATASWVINQYFRGVKCLAQGHNMVAVGFEPPTSRSGVRHSTTEPPRSPTSPNVSNTMVSGNIRNVYWSCSMRHLYVVLTSGWVDFSNLILLVFSYYMFNLICNLTRMIFKMLKELCHVKTPLIYIHYIWAAAQQKLWNDMCPAKTDKPGHLPSLIRCLHEEALAPWLSIECPAKDWSDWICRLISVLAGCMSFSLFSYVPA